MVSAPVCRWNVRRSTSTLAVIFSLILAWVPLQADVARTKGNSFGADVSRIDGDIAIDFAGSIWVMPANGGQAKQLTDGLIPAAAPRWSPDGNSILYHVRTAGGSEIWQMDVATTDSRRISEPGYHYQDASWYPLGERIVYASDRGDTGLDIWESDLPTGLSWRITSQTGDETEPAWSTNGHHLAYIRQSGGRHALILRRRGEPEQILIESDARLSSPSWRPDGSLLTFLLHGEEGPSLQMVILSDPPLIRTLATGEDFFASPVSWRDRMQMIYSADGAIKMRDFEDRMARRLPIVAIVSNETAPAPRVVLRRELKVTNPPQGRLVIRGARLFDGIWNSYRQQMDVLIERGRIVAVERRHDWDDATVLDLGNVTVMPGLIDSWSRSPATLAEGTALLTYGVTTIVSATAKPGFDLSAWEDEFMPGPRILPAATAAVPATASDQPAYYLVRISPAAADVESIRNYVDAWHARGVPVVADNRAVAMRVGAGIILGADPLQADARQVQFSQTEQIESQLQPTLISALADAGTPGILTLLNSRQATLLGQVSRPGRRIAGNVQLATASSRVVAGSEPNGLAPGLALHAELRAIQGAGLTAEQTVHSAGKNAAAMLGLDNQIGTITPGAMADLILVDGDPLGNIDDLIKIVAVVRNGRFFSLVSLLERANETTTVE